MDGAQRVPYLIPPADTARPRVSYPPWMDPLYLLQSSQYIYSAVQTIDATLIGSVPRNPLRWALGIYIDRLGLGATMLVSPFPEADRFVEAQQDTTLQLSATWITLFTRGPLVSAEWYISGQNGMTWRYIEIALYDGGGHVG